MSKYCLARCELYCQKSHGPLNSPPCPIAINKIICMESFENDEYIDYINNHLWKDMYMYMTSIFGSSFIRNNYKKIVDEYFLNNEPVINSNQICKKKFINKLYLLLKNNALMDPFNNNINIIQKIIIPLDIGDYTTCIIKTFWIKLIQRNWKKIYSIRKQIIKNRMTPNNIFYREIHGIWPYKINYLPTIRDIEI